MRRAWHVWRTICVVLVSVASLGALALGTWIAATDALTPPVSVSLSPDGAFSLRAFSAGQSNIPPDYRADVRFVLRRRAGWFWSRDTLVAHAALADGWAATWSGPRAISIEAGPLSWFATILPRADDVSVTVRIHRRSTEEAGCIGQTLTDAINGIVCFDALLDARQTPDMTKRDAP